MPNSLFFPTLIKNLRQSLVQLAEVIPTSSGRSSYPPSALTRGRLAHFSEIGIYAGNSVNRSDPDWNKVEHRDRSAKSLSHFHAPTLHYAISQPSWLHFVFPTLAQGCFSFFIFLWQLTFRITNILNQVFHFSIQFKVNTFFFCLFLGNDNPFLRFS